MRRIAWLLGSLFLLCCRGQEGAASEQELAVQERGPTALDLVQDPSILVDPLVSAIDQTLAEIDQAAPARPDPGTDLSQSLMPFRRLLLASREALGQAHRQLPDGEVCAAGASLVLARQGLDLLVATAKVAERLVNAPRDQDTQSGDATPQGGRLAVVHYFELRFAEMAAEAQDAETAVRALCRSLGAPRTVTGTVMKIDDAKRRIRLADGTILGLRETRNRNPVSAGVRISAQARFFADGSGFATVYNVVPLENGDLALAPCIDVRLAPVQPFPPLFANGTALGTDGRTGLPAPLPGAGPYGLTRIAGYEQAQNLRYFEVGMRMAAVKQACLADNNDTDQHFHRYSLEIAYLVGGDTYTVADQLEPGDAPAPFPPNTPLATSGLLRVRTKVQECDLVVGLTPFKSRLSSDEIHACSPTTSECACDPNASFCPVLPDFDDFFVDDPYQCTAPQYLSSQILPVTFGAQGSFCSVEYEKKTFDLEDDDVSGFRSTQISGVTKSFSSSTVFWADGYVPQAPAPYFGSTTIVTPMKVQDQQSFGIFSFEPCGPVSTPGNSTPTSGCSFPDDTAFARSAFGVTRPAGLRWPRIVGKNLLGNQTYAYSCTVPRITRDALGFCGLGSDPMFYRSPFGSDALPPFPITVTMGQANCACCGNCGCTHCCGCTQNFAFDFVPNEVGAQIRATRGGVVKSLVTTATDNCWQQPCPGPGGAWGNYVTIEHQDGTAGSYMHMPFGFPSVVLGQHIKRGDVIGIEGNTGNSSSAHTHHQEQVSVSNGTTQLMLYRIARWDGSILNGSWTTLDCYTPVSGDLLTWVH